MKKYMSPEINIVHVDLTINTISSSGEISGYSTTALSSGRYYDDEDEDW